MKNFIQFSAFGNYEAFTTSNVEKYMGLIQFFNTRGYKPMTANELKLLPNGQAQVFVMPTFHKGADFNIDITTSRINFSLSSMETIQNLFELFNSEMKELIADFTTKFEVVSNRLAINCNVETSLQDNEEINEIDIENTHKTESHLRQCFRGNINNEECNIIVEKNNVILANITQYAYDVNTIAENASFRFKDQAFLTMLDAMGNMVLSIKGDS